MVPYYPEINNCVSNPCSNGATCQNYVNGYTCLCPIGYTGVHCEQGNYYYVIVFVFVLL